MSHSDESKDNSAKGLSRRDFLQTAGMATLAIGSGAMSLPRRQRKRSRLSLKKQSPGDRSSPNDTMSCSFLPTRSVTCPSCWEKATGRGEIAWQRWERPLKTIKSAQWSAHRLARSFSPVSTSSTPGCSTIRIFPGATTCHSTFPPSAT